ncbi:MAG: alpha/beta fold hydrolase [Chloroflexota bacterium]|nr:alpha/beta fold hydrolase [Chloroflexota bacterium]
MRKQRTSGEFIQVNGTRLYCAVTGAEKAPAVVFVHGFSLDTRMWDGQVEAFSTRYRVVRYDLRGFGQSAVPEAGVPYQHDEDLVGLLDALGIEPAVLVGLSMGGAVALNVVLRHPERVSALVLAASLLPGFETPEFDGITRPIWTAGRISGADAARALWVDCAIFAVINEQRGPREVLRAIVSDYSGWGWTERDPGAWAEPDSVAQLDRIDAPTLVVAGERDIDDMRRMADTLASSIPGARKVIMPGLGHLPNMEDAEAFNSAVLDFLIVMRL